MTYIDKDDILDVIQQQLITPGLADSSTATVDLSNNEMLNRLETKAIDRVKSFISIRYDCDKIFASTPIRNETLVQIIAAIVVYRAVRRNAARKVPDDYVKLYDDTTNDLTKIQNGGMMLPNCPAVETLDERGNDIPNSYGTTYNPDFFI